MIGIIFRISPWLRRRRSTSSTSNNNSIRELLNAAHADRGGAHTWVPLSTVLLEATPPHSPGRIMHVHIHLHTHTHTHCTQTHRLQVHLEERRLEVDPAPRPLVDTVRSITTRPRIRGSILSVLLCRVFGIKVYLRTTYNQISTFASLMRTFG
jgi:hypothetical protein